MYLAAYTRVGDPEETPGSQLPVESALAIAVISGVNQQMKNLSVSDSLSLCVNRLSNYNKYNLKKREREKTEVTDKDQEYTFKEMISKSELHRNHKHK